MTRKKISSILAALLSIFILYTAAFGQFEILVQRAVFAALIIGLGFARFPMFKDGKNGAISTIFDICLGSVCIIACVLVVINHASIMEDLPEASTWDIFLAATLVLTVLELCRRTVGMAFTAIVLAVLLYAYWGHLIPGQFGHKQMGIGFLAETLYLSDLGIWGSLTGIGATLVAVFIMFGSLLLFTGGGQTFVDIAAFVGGKSPGGAAKMATIASAFFGMMAGNSVGNVATTGNVTIPMMKRLGYPPAFAAGVESVASTGGQMTPPILGAAAFIIAEILGLSYWRVVGGSIIPAFLFYTGIYLTLHTSAVRLSLGKMSDQDLPSLKDTFAWLRMLPLVLGFGGLTAGILNGNSIVHSVFYGLAGLIISYVVIQYKAKKPLGEISRGLMDVLVKAGEGLVLVGVLLLGAQILVCLVNATGVAGTLANFIISYASNNLLLLGLITAAVGLVMGMGLPTLPAYVLVGSILSPALIQAGVAPLAAHMFVFYYACLSAITPPVCAAVFVAAGIADTSWSQVAREAVKFGMVTYILPMMFLYYPGILGIGDWVSIVFDLLAGLSLAIGTAYLMAKQKLFNSIWLDRAALLGTIILALSNNQYMVSCAIILAALFLLLAKKNNKIIMAATEPAAAQA